MGVTLACTWRPRGELPRFQRLHPQLAQMYESITIATPPGSDRAAVHQMGEEPGITVVTSSIAGARYLALQTALATPASHIYLADLDRLVRWAETRPEEWRRVVEAVQQADCLIVGRTEYAMQTHPQALRQTEQLINAVFSDALGQPLDLGGGMRGFSRAAARVVLANSQPGWWGDAAWPVIVQRAGFAVRYLAVDGMDWETPDRYRERAADADTQRRAAEDYDADADHWACRVRVALEIVQEGLAARRRALVEGV